MRGAAVRYTSARAGAGGEEPRTGTHGGDANGLPSVRRSAPGTPTVFF
jgi:hypothetical protein